MNYYISDMHLGHAQVIKFDGLPFADVEEMDRVLIERWNEVVGDDDDVYVVGDFCYRAGHPADWYLEQLKGRKHLIVGNHDGMSIHNEKAMAMFVSVDNMLEVADNGQHILLCHYPLAELPNARRTTWHIHGHVHNRRNKTYEFMRTVERALNAAASVNGFRPVNFAELLANNRCFDDETNGELWFFSRSPRGREFSNFFQAPFMIDGETWSCVEQYYQCAKFARGTEPYNRIRAQRSPGCMKRIVSLYEPEVRVDWDDVKVDVMERAVRAKFAQNPHLLDLYAPVSDFALIHESASDMFWGMNRDRKGENRLGKLVKAVCDECLRKKT